MKRTIRRARNLGLVLLAWGLIHKSGIMHHPEITAATFAQAHLPTIFKTIPSVHTDTGLLGYELHTTVLRDPRDMGTRRVYSAVIRELEPGTDDYRAMCRDIVTDIIETYGQTQMTINIFDSFEAYCFYESDNRMGTQWSSGDLLGTHMVASYVHLPDYQSFTFYPQAAGERREEATL